MKYKRILLKLSGESLMGERGYGIDENRLQEYAVQIKEIAEMGVQIGIVIGGGNIFRGLSGAGKGFVIVSGDDSTAPILGYTEQGDFVWDELPEQLQQMLKAWEQAIGETQKAPRRVGPRRSVSERLEAARRGVESFKEDKTHIHINAVIYVERDSQKGIIIGHGGKALKRVATEARKSLEKFFGKRIYLETFVKVDKDWRNSTKELNLFGYNPE